MWEFSAPHCTSPSLLIFAIVFAFWRILPSPSSFLHLIPLIYIARFMIYHLPFPDSACRCGCACGKAVSGLGPGCALCAPFTVLVSYWHWLYCLIRRARIGCDNDMRILAARAFLNHIIHPMLTTMAGWGCVVEIVDGWLVGGRSRNSLGAGVWRFLILIEGWCKAVL